MLRQQPPAQAWRGRDADLGSGAAPVEGDRDGPGEVLLSGLREDQPGASTVTCRPAGPSLLAMIMFENLGQHEPLNRQAERYVLAAFKRSPTSAIGEWTGSSPEVARRRWRASASLEAGGSPANFNTVDLRSSCAFSAAIGGCHSIPLRGRDRRHQRSRPKHLAGQLGATVFILGPDATTPPACPLRRPRARTFARGHTLD